MDESEERPTRPTPRTPAALEGELRRQLRTEIAEARAAADGELTDEALVNVIAHAIGFAFNWHLNAPEHARGPMPRTGGWRPAPGPRGQRPPAPDFEPDWDENERPPRGGQWGGPRYGGRGPRDEGQGGYGDQRGGGYGPPREGQGGYGGPNRYGGGFGGGQGGYGGPRRGGFGGGPRGGGYGGGGPRGGPPSRGGGFGPRRPGPRRPDR